MLLPGLLALALLGQAPQRTYYWRDSAGQTHVTNTPPPSDAELLEAPPPAAVVPGKADRPQMLRTNAGQGQNLHPLSAAQQRAWEALDKHLAKARAEGDRRTLEAVSDSLINDCLWGHGLWALPLLPVLSVTLLSLLGWWLALGIRTGSRVPLVVGFFLLGLACGQLLLNVYLYRPMALRLWQNMELLMQHMGTGKALRPEHRVMLQQRYQALQQAADPLQAPWHFPTEVRNLRKAMQQVMVEP